MKIEAPGTSGGLELVALRKSFSGVRAVDGLNLSVRPGEFVTLLGPSGSGKTTTLMMIAGFIEPESGSIMLDGREITNLPAHRRAIGVVFQSYALFPHMTVRENVAFALTMRDLREQVIAKRVRRMLELMGLQKMEDRYPKQLSGGQQQRVALARALVFEPRLLLLDEPLGALDRVLRERMKLELRRVHEEIGTTMVYVTHDQDEALVLSGQVVVMNEGRIEQNGAPAEIYERPANRFVADFIGETNFVGGRIERVEGQSVAVAVGSAILHGTASAHMHPGDDAELAVRPEKISLSASTGDPGKLRGIIDDRIYSGDSVRYVVRLNEPTKLTVKQLNYSGVLLDRGDTVNVTWSPDCAIVFPAHR